MRLLQTKYIFVLDLILKFSINWNFHQHNCKKMFVTEGTGSLIFLVVKDHDSRQIWFCKEGKWPQGIKGQKYRTYTRDQNCVHVALSSCPEDNCILFLFLFSFVKIPNAKTLQKFHCTSKELRRGRGLKFPLPYGPVLMKTNKRRSRTFTIWLNNEQWLVNTFTG